MKTIKNLLLAVATLTVAASAHAEWVSGHFRSSGTYVAPYYRTPANGIVYDNLSYRGYPSQQPGYISPGRYDLNPSWSRPTPLPDYGIFDVGMEPCPYTEAYPTTAIATC